MEAEIHIYDEIKVHKIKSNRIMITVTAVIYMAGVEDEKGLNREGFFEEKRGLAVEIKMDNLKCTLHI